MAQKLQLSASQLSRSNLLTLEIFLDLTKKDETATWEYTDNVKAAAALIIDADTDLGRRELAQLVLQGGRQVLIAFSGDRTGFPGGVLVLPRPLRSAELLSVLRQASEKILNAFQEKEETGSPQGALSSEGSAKPSSVADGSESSRRVIAILCANQSKILKVTDRLSRVVIFEMERRRYYTAGLSQMDVEDLIASPAGSSRFEEIGSSQLLSETQNLKPQDLEPPLWTAALAVSNGKLFEGLSSTGFYRLNRWPDLKKLGQDPLHLKLTALLRRGGAIDYFVDFTKGSAGDVIDFLNACRALNCLELQTQQAATPVKTPEPQKPNTGKLSLFSRIRSRLGI